MSVVVYQSAMRVVGGANVPAAKVMRINATWPFAVLEIVGTRLTLELRWLGRLFGPDSLSAEPDELKRVYPIRGFMSAGVGFTRRDGRDFYMWTGKGESVLDRLRDLGYPVSRQVEKPSKVWRATP